MHLKIKLGSHPVFELLTGAHLRAQRELAGAVSVSGHAARLAAQLTEGLGTQVLMRKDGETTAFYLMDRLGQPVCNHGPDRRATTARARSPAGRPSLSGPSGWPRSPPIPTGV
ncbi:hypothetical protein WKI65_44080 [Streptomyces sp. MS1.AVA.3]|uniref:hypothetical protein n=1 Tax=Streptomyces decoyicus TaxID=249567 RepID=UPI0030C37A88